jgi:hypothetical protein
MAQAESVPTTRRNVLKSIPAVALAGGALSLPVYDQIADLLSRRKSLIWELEHSSSEENGGTGNIDDEDSRWEEIDSLEEAIIGLPALTAAGALACMEAFFAENCADDTDEWLLKATADYLRGNPSACGGNV